LPFCSSATSFGCHSSRETRIGAGGDQAAKGYVFHRDPLSAARTALGALIILSGCLIGFTLPGPMAHGGSDSWVCCTLFGSFDTPAPHIVKYIIGSVWGVLISLSIALSCFRK
jgi:hypothetical protein